MNARAVSRTLANVLVASALALLVTSVVTGNAIAAEGQQGVAPARLSQGGGQYVGKQVYDKWCAPCHAPGPDHPGTTALDALYKGSKPGALIERSDLTPPIIKQFVRKGMSVMPFFRKTEISDAELDALATFLSKAKA